MSIVFAKHFGATFQEAVVHLEALKQAKFDDSTKESIRLSQINYIETKIWSIYPYQCEDYFQKNPNQSERKTRRLKEERKK